MAIALKLKFPSYTRYFLGRALNVGVPLAGTRGLATNRLLVLGLDLPSRSRSACEVGSV